MGCVIAIESITYAIKARDILRRNNYRVRVEKGGANRKGCVYSLIVEGNCETAVNILKANGIKIIN